MRDFALALSAHVAEATEANLAQAECSRPRSDTLMAAQPPLERGMRRLACWLLTAPLISDGAAGSAVVRQSDEGASWTGHVLSAPAATRFRVFAQAYGACREAAITRRNKPAKPFANALIEWNANKPSVDGPLCRSNPYSSMSWRQSLPPIRPAAGDGWAEHQHLPGTVRARSAKPWLGRMVPSDLGQPRRRGGTAHRHRGQPYQPAFADGSRWEPPRRTIRGFASHAGLLAPQPRRTPPSCSTRAIWPARPTLAPKIFAAIADPHQQ